jgi:hypothetical protein
MSDSTAFFAPDRRVQVARDGLRSIHPSLADFSMARTAHLLQIRAT